MEQVYKDGGSVDGVKRRSIGTNDSASTISFNTAVGTINGYQARTKPNVPMPILPQFGAGS